MLQFIIYIKKKFQDNILMFFIRVGFIIRLITYNTLYFGVFCRFKSINGLHLQNQTTHLLSHFLPSLGKFHHHHHHHHQHDNHPIIDAAAAIVVVIIIISPVIITTTTNTTAPSFIHTATRKHHHLNHHR